MNEKVTKAASYQRKKIKNHGSKKEEMIVKKRKKGKKI